jgi:hypothetical protein
MNQTVERLIEIEQEREQTQSNPEFHEWIKQMNVSRLYVDKKGLFQAKDIMNQYDYSKYTYHINIS